MNVMLDIVESGAKACIFGSYGIFLIKEIIKKYNDLGEKGVKNLKNKNREHRGAKQPLLTEEDLKKLSQELESRPSDGGIWTGPKVARWMESEKGVLATFGDLGWGKAEGSPNEKISSP